MEALKNPLVAQLEITDRCNYRCAHCYHLDFDPANASDELSDENFYALAKKMVEAGIFSVIITGGEPLFRSGLVIGLIRFFKKAGLDVSLNTNLSLANERLLIDLFKAGLDTFLVSCPASGEEKYREMTGGSYSRFVQNIGFLVSHDYSFAVNMVVNARNIDLIRETAAAMCGLGVKRFGATPMALNPLRPDLEHFLSAEQVVFLVRELLWTREELGLAVDIFEALPKCIFPPDVLAGDYRFLRRSCQAGRTTISIGCNGDVRPCSHSDKIFGNLLHEELPDIWAKMSGYRDGSRIPEACSGCKNLSSCAGGCRVTAETCGKGKNPNDPWMTKPLVDIRGVPIRKELLGENTISMPGSLRFRQEGDDTFVVTTAKFVGNFALVNGEMFVFLQRISSVSGSTLESLARSCETSFSSEVFQGVIRRLSDYRLISVK